MNDIPGNSKNSFARYLPKEPDSDYWGVDVLDAGHTLVKAGEAYPPGHHPDAYCFSSDGSRVLGEYQIVVILEGAGRFESRRGGRHPVAAGSVFILFPGEWHRYAPFLEKGWEDAWVGFSGRYAESLMRQFFSPEKPCLISDNPGLLKERIGEIEEYLTQQSRQSRVLAGLRTLELIALLRGEGGGEDGGFGAKLAQVKLEILSQVSERINWAGMAQKLGWSPLGLRRRFKQQTGMSPLQYQLQIRLNRAQALLEVRGPSSRRHGRGSGLWESLLLLTLLPKAHGMQPWGVEEKGSEGPGWLKKTGAEKCPKNEAFRN